MLKPWVRFVVGVRKEIVIALDWTDFEKDDHTTLCAYLVTSHGRATPLAWKTVKKSTLKGTRNNHEYELVERLHEFIDADVEVILLADRGFGDQKLYDLLQLLGWDFVIRFRGCIGVQKRRRGDAGCRGLGAGERARDDAPQRGRHRRPREGPGRGRRPRAQDEGGVVPGHDALDTQGVRGRQALRQEVLDRGDLPRREEPPLRDGSLRDAHP